MTVEKIEIPESQYKAILAANPKEAAQFTPRPITEQVFDPEHPPAKAGPEKPAEPVAKVTDDTPAPEEIDKKDEKGNDAKPVEKPVDEEDLGDGLKRRKIDGVWHVPLKINGREQMVKQSDMMRLVQSQAAITQGFQRLSAREQELEKREKALKEETEGLKEISSLFQVGQPAAPSEGMDDILGITKPTPRPQGTDPVVAKMQETINRMDARLKTVEPMAEQNAATAKVNEAAERACQLMSDLGVEPPKDWTPVAQALMLEHAGDRQGYMRAITDPMTLARVAREVMGSAPAKTPDEKKPSATPKPPNTTTVHRQRSVSSGGEVEKLVAERDRLTKLSNSKDGQGPNGWKIIAKIKEVNDRITSLSKKEKSDG
jgi:hypothetical protein